MHKIFVKISKHRFGFCSDPPEPQPLLDLIVVMSTRAAKSRRAEAAEAQTEAATLEAGTEGGAKSRLTEAAEALVEAATLEAGAITNKEVVTAIESLKTTFQCMANSFNKDLVTVRNDIASLKSDIRSMKAMMKEELKQARLQRAREFVDLSSFTYYDDDGVDGYSGHETKDLAMKALVRFSLGQGMTLPNGRMHRDAHFYHNVEESQRSFREKFSM